MCSIIIVSHLVPGLPADVRQEDGTRESYQLAFGAMDNDDSKTIEWVSSLYFFVRGHVCARANMPTNSVRACVSQ